MSAAEGERGRAPRGRASAVRITTVLCLAEVLGMVAFATYSANVPGFIAEWGLTNTEAGWIGGVFSLGNLLALPFLVSLTDRIDARLIYIASTGLMGAAHLCFGLFADGFWSAMLFRGLAGVGYGGSFIPGMRLLGDLVAGPGHARAITLYSGGAALGGAISFFISGIAFAWLDWRWAFLLGGLGCLLALLGVLFLVPSAEKRPAAAARPPLLDFRPVLRNRRTVGYILANVGHQFETYGARGWTVAFFAFALAAQGLDRLPLGLSPPILMSAVVLIGFGGNYAGGALAQRYGRTPVVVGVALASLAAALAVGLSPLLPFVLVVAAVCLHSATMTADNAVLNAGALSVAAPETRGATMAVYGFFGFLGAMVGPTMFGIVLDLVGSHSFVGWLAAFATLGLVGLLGATGLVLAERSGRRGPGERGESP